MQKKSNLVIIVLIFMLTLTFVSADSFGYDTDDIINSPFGYDTEDHPTPIFEHAHIYTHTDASLTVPVAGSWVNITFDTHAPSVQDRIAHNWTDSTNDTFTIIDSGEYNVQISLVAIDAAAAPTSQVEYRILKSNVEVGGSGRSIDINRQNFDRSKDSFAIVDAFSGDEIIFQFTADSVTAGIIANCAYLDHCVSAAISIERAT